MKRTPKVSVARQSGGPHRAVIGGRIRRLRLQQARTQEDVAKASGFTKSMLSKIESGVVYPSVAALVRVAKALGVGVAALMEQSAKDGPVFVPRAQAESLLTHSDKGYAAYPYATEFVDKKMQPFLLVLKKGQVKPHSVSHPGEEFVCVLEGEILFRVGDTEHRMRAGDGLFFNSLDKHGVMPLTDTAKYINVFV